MGSTPFSAQRASIDTLYPSTSSDTIARLSLPQLRENTATMSDEIERPHHNAQSIERNRFPTLFEVLSRKTVAPLDLFSFYIYMRDQQRSVDYLDFW